MWQGIIHRYKNFLPISDGAPIVTLKEGNTPLILSKSLKKIIGLNVYLKYEGANPTGSFKDRGMTMAISKALEKKATAVMCASTGNTSASAAAFSACCDLSCIVVIPDNNIALGKLAQAMIHGAKVISIQGNFDDALNLVKEITDHYPIELVNSLNPFRIEGQKTAAFEICDALLDAPDFHSIPVGNAGNITAYWKGYKEYYTNGITSRLPKMLGFQASKSAPIVDNCIVSDPETIATAIRIGNPASWKTAKAAREESDGLIEKVTDQEILAAYKILAQKEGLFVEPASAASVAGILKLSEKKYFKNRNENIVCTLTGHGLKDPNLAIKNIDKPPVLKPDLNTILKEIELF